MHDILARPPYIGLAVHFFSHVFGCLNFIPYFCILFCHHSSFVKHIFIYIPIHIDNDKQEQDKIHPLA